MMATENVLFRWTGGGNEVYLCGTFSDWTKIPMTKRKDNSFHISVPLCQGRHEYKFVVDGEWAHDKNQATVPDGHGGTNNTIICAAVLAVPGHKSSSWFHWPHWFHHHHGSSDSKDVNEGQLKATLKRLQAEVGSTPEITIDSFVNWGQTVKLGNVFKTKPTSAEEVQSVVKAARQQNLQVRVVGSTHSWSPLYPDDGHILMDGTGLKKHADGKCAHFDKATMTVNIMSGVDMAELMDFFLEKNLCFPSGTLLTQVTTAGTIATGCHGVGQDQPCLSDWVTAITVVDSKGDIREFSQAKDGSDVMKAAQVNLGMFGVMITVTMKVQWGFLVKTDNLFPQVKDMFFDPKHLRQFVRNNWSVEIFWFPFNSMEVEHLDLWRAAVKGEVGNFSWNPMADEVWVRAINPYKPGELHLPPVSESYQRDFSAVDNLTGKLTQWVGKIEHYLNEFGDVGKIVDHWFHHHADPLLIYAGFKVAKDQYSEVVAVCQNINYAIHYRKINTAPVYDMEFAFHCPDTDEGFRNACLAITKVVEIVQREAQKGKYPLTTAMEMRWIAHSDTLLAPARAPKPDSTSKGGYTFYLEVLSYVDNEQAMAFFKEVAEYWKTLELEGVKPVPHWGKQWRFIPNINKYFRECFGDNMKRFKEVRASLKVDEDNMFTNKRLRDIFEL